MVTFQYHPEIWMRFPSLAGGVIYAQGMQNRPTPPEVLALYQEEQQRVKTQIGEMPLSQIKSLASWRSAFRQFGVEPTQYRSAAEALLRRLTKQGDIPSINLLVDLGNLISIRYALPIAVMDTRSLADPITVKLATGEERYTQLGESEAAHPEPGEVVFVDGENRVVARRWCWRQSEESAAREDTTEAVITIEAHHETGRSDVASAVRDLVSLLEQYAGGTYQFNVLHFESRSFQL